MKLEKIKNKFDLALKVYLISWFLAACGSSPVEATKPVVKNPNTIEPTVLYDATATVEPPKTPTAEAPRWAGGGAVSETLFNEILNTPYVQGQIEKFEKDWKPYWAQGGAITLDSTDLRYDVVFDKFNSPTGANDPELNNKVNVLLYWDGVGHYFPVDYINTNEKDGVKFQTVPPGGIDFIEFGTGPLALTGNPVWRKEWMRIDQNTGVAKERIQRVDPYSWEQFDPWIDLFAERGEYVPGGLGLGEKTAQTLKFNPKADQKAIHDQILASQMRQLMIPENKYILDKLLQEHPEWAGTAWNSIANPFELRLLIMEAVMKITGGRLFTKLWPSNSTALTDYNQPVKFECEQVAQVPSKPELTLHNDTIADGVYINSSGGLVFREEFTKKYKESDFTITSKPFDFYCSFRMLALAESQARGFERFSGFIDGVNILDFRKFALDLNNITMLHNPDAYQEYFLKLK